MHTVLYRIAIRRSPLSVGTGKVPVPGTGTKSTTYRGFTTNSSTQTGSPVSLKMRCQGRNFRCKRNWSNELKNHVDYTRMTFSKTFRKRGLVFKKSHRMQHTPFYKGVSFLDQCGHFECTVNDRRALWHYDIYPPIDVNKPLDGNKSVSLSIF